MIERKEGDVGKRTEDDGKMEKRRLEVGKLVEGRVGKKTAKNKIYTSPACSVKNGKLFMLPQKKSHHV